MDIKKIINPWKGMAGYNCFGCAPDNPVGLHLEFYEDGDDIVTQWEPSANYQGWSGIIHGGIQALLLDEVCGWVVSRKLQTAGVTMTMETRYVKPVSSDNKVLTLRAHVRKEEGSGAAPCPPSRTAVIDASLLDENGRVCTQAVCKYYLFTHEKAMQVMKFRECHTEDELGPQ